VSSVRRATPLVAPIGATTHRDPSPIRRRSSVRAAVDSGRPHRVPLRSGIPVQPCNARHLSCVSPCTDVRVARRLHYTSHSGVASLSRPRVPIAPVDWRRSINATAHPPSRVKATSAAITPQYSDAPALQPLRKRSHPLCHAHPGRSAAPIARAAGPGVYQTATPPRPCDRRWPGRRARIARPGLPDRRRPGPIGGGYDWSSGSACSSASAWPRRQPLANRKRARTSSWSPSALSCSASSSAASSSTRACRVPCA